MDFMDFFVCSAHFKLLGQKEALGIAHSSHNHTTGGDVLFGAGVLVSIENA